MARAPGIKRMEIVVFTNEYGLPLREPELRMLTDPGYIVPLPQVTTVRAVVGPSDVSHVEVTFIATLRYEIEERQSNLTLFDKEDSPE